MLKDLSSNSGNEQPQNVCKTEQLLQLIRNFKQQEWHLLEHYKKDVNVDGTDFERYLHSKVIRLEKEQAEAEEAYVETQADLERHQMQILRAEEAIFQQTDASFLANMANKLEHQLAAYVDFMAPPTPLVNHQCS